jgi:class 3 adenylate cyclase
MASVEGGLPTGTVTFLFTDLEGSTRLWEEHPEAMRDALACHDELLREAVAAHGGEVVKSTGDGLHAVFATADGGVEAAVAAQIALDSQVWGETGALRVRMGLHSGTADYRGGDYFGPTINRAARVAEVAHGGQIVVSHATEELARDALGATVGLRDLGEHELRDLGHPERLFQVLHPELVSEFPPLRSLDVLPGNLPVQVTSFVGREEELARVAGELGEARVVTLTGVGADSPSSGPQRTRVRVAINFVGQRTGPPRRASRANRGSVWRSRPRAQHGFGPSSRSRALVAPWYHGPASAGQLKRRRP